MCAEVEDSRVLVLNRLWQPVNIVGVRRAYSLLSQDHAQVINTADGSYLTLNLEAWIAYSIEHPPGPGQASISTIKYCLRVPAVVLLNDFDRVPAQEVKFNRKAVFDRDHHECQYCGRKFQVQELTLDHVIPRDMGGRTTWENIVTSCIHCNSEKANRMPHQAGMHLAEKPVRPKSRPFPTALATLQPREEWQSFVR
jgi:hypothetical protein